jgi:hypothetical protein
MGLEGDHIPDLPPDCGRMTTTQTLAARAGNLRSCRPSIHRYAAYGKYQVSERPRVRIACRKISHLQKSMASF